MFIVGCAVGLVYYGWYHSDHMHFHISKAYANLGHKDAQATVGHKLLNGQSIFFFFSKGLSRKGERDV